MTDVLQILTGNTAKFAGGTIITAKYIDIIRNRDKPEDKRSGEEIVADIVAQAGLELV